jgi:CheY-like chemotaxis protein
VARDGRHYPEIAEIRRAARRASDLTGQLLAFSRRQAFQPRPLRLNRVVREMEQMLGRLIRADIELVTELEPDLHVVLADPGQIEQVVTNLVVNARDAMPRGGKLTIATDNVVVDPATARRYPALEAGEYVRLEVRDTGEGVDAALRESIFEPFFTTKGVGEGTGLGLAVVYGIVEQSGGHIVVESEPGRGASFAVYLPPAGAGAGEAPGEAASEPAAVGGRETILLVEDERLVRQLAARLLSDAGYRVLVAAGGWEALELAQSSEGRIHLLLTDVVMPELPGPDLAVKVLEIRPEVKVLFMSGYSGQALGEDGGLLVGAPLLRKPFDSGELLSFVREVLGPAEAHEDATAGDPAIHSQALSLRSGD